MMKVENLADFWRQKSCNCSQGTDQTAFFRRDCWPSVLQFHGPSCRRAEQQTFPVYLRVTSGFYFIDTEAELLEQ